FLVAFQLPLLQLGCERVDPFGEAVDEGADRHFDDLVLGPLAVALFAASAFAVFGADDRFKKKRAQGVDMGVGPQDDAAAPPPVTAIRAAFGDKLCPAEAATSVAPVP